MGKQLIIKGADFLANKIKTEEWYYYAHSEHPDSQAGSEYSPLALSTLNNSFLIGKKINTIKVPCNASGTLAIGILANNAIITQQNFSVIAGYNTLTLNTPITLDNGQKITFSGINLEGVSAISMLSDYSAGITPGYSYTTDQANPCGVTGGNVCLLLDFGYIE